MERVLHINDYPVNAGGGAEVVMSRTIALLRHYGIAVDTFTSADLADQARKPWRYIDNVLARRALAAKLDAFRPDVIHLHNWYHVLSPGILDTLAEFKRKRSLRVVMSAHDYHLICPNAGGCWFRRWSGAREPIESGRFTLGALLGRRWDERTAMHSLLKLSQHLWNYRWRHRERVIDLVICPSRFVQRMLAPTGLPTCWLPHPAPRIAGSSRNFRRGERVRFVFAGRIEPEKGLFEFLQQLPSDFRDELTVIGEGSDLPRCWALVEARRWMDRVQFLGRMAHNDTLAEIGRCHVLVQPSRVLETYGLTLIEALAVGTNVLVSDRGAAREIVDDSGVGFLFDIDDAENLAEKARLIQTSHGNGTLNGFDAAKFLATRSESSYVEQLLEAYRNSSKARQQAA